MLCTESSVGITMNTSNSQSDRRTETSKTAETDSDSSLSSKGSDEPLISNQNYLLKNIKSV